MTETHEHDLGLAYDLSKLLDRRRAMRLIVGGIGVAALAACGRNSNDAIGTSATTSSTSGATSTTSGSSAGGSSTSPSPSSSAPGTASATCETIPAETAGPFPGDGSNGPNALSDSGVVRRDITSSFGSSTTKAAGIPLTINLVILDQSNGCKAMSGAAVYLWHCDREGRYSMYSQGATNENYLRGVQETDTSGRVTFQSIFPAAYSGRWPHIHFEIYPSLAKATASSSKLATSQLALPEAACKAVYATSGYEASVRNFAQTPLSRDNVFSDGSSQQMATVTGSTSAGYTAELSVPI